MNIQNWCNGDSIVDARKNKIQRSIYKSFVKKDCVEPMLSSKDSLKMVSSKCVVDQINKEKCDYDKLKSEPRFHFVFI